MKNTTPVSGNSARQKQSRLSFIGGGVALALAVVLIAYGGYGLWQRWTATSNSTVEVSNEVVTVSVNTPDEALPSEDACKEQALSSAQPRKIVIPYLGVDGCIEKVGIDQHGAIAVPTNIHFAGWYVDSAMPGEKGLSVIDGHVLGRYNDAIFARLAQIRPGEDINIEFTNDTSLQFEMVDIRTFAAEEASQRLFEKLPGVEHQLTLVTCIGAYDQAANTYDKRVIVRSALKDAPTVD